MSIAEKLQTVAENEQRVYDAGFAAGQATGGDTEAAYNVGYDAGKHEEYDRFWDGFQQSGNRTNYVYAFAGQAWNERTFKPKYDLKPIQADYMFAESKAGVQETYDVAQILDDCGIVLDTSQCTSFSNFMRYNSTRHMPALDTRSADTLNNMFTNCSIVTVDKLIFREDGSQNVANMFFACTGLKDIKEVEGVIGKDMNLSKSTQLSKLTTSNVMNALSGTTTGTTLQLSQTAVNTAFETEEGVADGSTSAEWLALLASKSNWTITLV